MEIEIGLVDDNVTLQQEHWALVPDAEGDKS